MWPADFRHGDDVWREKKSFLFFDGRASSSLTGNTSKRNYYYIHTYSLLYSITCLPYLVVTALQSNFIVRISDSKKTHNNCQHKAPRATLQQGPATQTSTQRTKSTAETHQFIFEMQSLRGGSLTCIIFIIYRLIIIMSSMLYYLICIRIGWL